MANYVGDRNQVIFLYESGTYATASGNGQWIGQVTAHSIDDSENVVAQRYAGAGTRNVGQFFQGPEDHTGTITYNIQDWKFLGFALGSIADGGSPSPYTHELKEINSNELGQVTSGTSCPFFSFTLEDSHEVPGTGLNFVRTLNGCNVDTITISAAEGEPLTAEVAYIAQSNIFSSGGITSVTAATTRPYQWQDVQVHLPSGTNVNRVRDMSLVINNTLEPHHYLNGSKVIDSPIPTNRDYELTLTLSENSENTKEFYDQYFRGGSTFNMMLQATASAGSREAFIILSGCKMMDMDDPTNGDATSNEQTLTIQPQTMNVEVNDLIELYAPW